MARSRMGLHTQEEREKAIHRARGVVEDAKRGILDIEDQGLRFAAFNFASGYLQALMDAADDAGLEDFTEEMIRMKRDLDAIYLRYR